ncbi:mannitol dehydrogenase family protein [Candidatus Kirkpatrickella diaphorinae]|uniref:Mannitol dehydrogenase family protein n=1 Tax=Candidatus Kirkpatrickella diaphorinae TaxID=2984322 RepID=A0ABY6GJ13_9PROT|nr:mannitol dehydrogenase family protein [Candidatus Kirkpatrickella diaphorinae]UYH51517.1 mannitol dehydrogenase family protein [Candidatus Kirkpatrickella diaphorinae]
MIPLNQRALTALPAGKNLFSYDRSQVRAGIVHLSVGNFHRAHQAWYVDQLLNHSGNTHWGICGVGLLDDENECLKRDVFAAQDNLYTLTRYKNDGSETHQIIGSIVSYLFAPDDRRAVLERMAAPEIRIVSMTITEGGYNQEPGTGRYRLDHPATQAELADPDHPHSAFGFIVAALKLRRARGIAPFTVLSCDNLRHNGRITHQAVVAHAEALDPELAAWIEENVTFPNAMVDRITPAVLKEDALPIDEASGIQDALPVISEDFAQWVIEDRFVNGRPYLEEVGVQFVEDVGPYELMKVRMLNAAHSVLAYPGQLAGFNDVRDAITNPSIRELVDIFLRRDVAPTLPAPKGMDLDIYRATIIKRFSNPHIIDRLPRITGDGWSKLATFLAPTFNHVVEEDGDVTRMVFVLACFTRYLRGVTDDGQEFEPFEPQMPDAEREASRHDALSLSVFQHFNLHQRPPIMSEIRRWEERIERHGTLKALERLLDG